MGEVRRVYVEKKKDYAVKAKELHASLKQYLGLDVESVRVLVRYDIENLSDASYEKALDSQEKGQNHQLTTCMKRHYHLPMGKYLSALSFCQVSSIREQILHSSV